MAKFGSATAFIINTPPLQLAACGRDILLFKRLNHHVSPTALASMNDEVIDAISEPSSQSILDISVADIHVGASSGTDVLSTEDIVVGTILAFILAFGYSYLNGQSTSSSFVSWSSQSYDENDALDSGSSVKDIATGNDDKTFNAESWKEMSREENYVLYNTKLRQKNRQKSGTISESQPLQKKQDSLHPRLSSELIWLLILFVPIFSVEFFFALSRQFMCEMGMEGELAQKLCSPLLMR